MTGIIESLRRDFPLLRAVPAPAWIVGGAVRDALLGRRPGDVDIACFDAEEVARVFARKARRKVITLGREALSAFRVVTDEGEYDFTEIVGPSIEADLGRRDFTMNAVAVSLENGELIDPFGGVRDIGEQLVRMVSPINFDEDPLRLLRGARMAARYGFAIERETLDAIRERANRILDVAPERVTYELMAMLAASPFRGIAFLHETGLDRVLFGRALHGGSLAVAAEGADAQVLVLALIFLSSGAGEVKSYASRWRWSEALLRDVESTIAFVSARLSVSERVTVLEVYDAGETTARRTASALRTLGRADLGKQIEELLDERGEGLFRIAPLLTGTEIGDLTGSKPGPAIGRLKRALLQAQVRGEVSDREAAEHFVRNWR